MRESTRYIVLGNVDAGKSSFVSVMCNNKLDNGNGSARSLIIKSKHELESGRTSSHTPHYMINDDNVITLVDLCGHEKYLKTTIFGVTGMFADYGILVIGSNQGVTQMMIEHLGLLISNKIPFIVILNKIDICPQNVMTTLKKQLERIARQNSKQLIYFTEDQKEITDSCSMFIESFQRREADIIPVISVSNKTGFNIEFVKNLLTTIEPSKEDDAFAVSYPTVMFVDHLFNVNGVGKVLSGTVKYGEISFGQKLYLGPLSGKYVPVVVKSMHNCISQNVNKLEKDRSGSIGIRLDNKSDFSKDMFRKGQILTTHLPFAVSKTCWSFECEVIIFNHPTTIVTGYQSVIHCGTVRQCAVFILPDENVLRSNSREIITIRFLFRPEFILSGSYFMFRDGRTKGMGRVRSCLQDVPEIPLRKR